MKQKLKNLLVKETIFFYVNATFWCTWVMCNILKKPDVLKHELNNSIPNSMICFYDQGSLEFNYKRWNHENTKKQV